MTTLSNLDILGQLGWTMQLIHNSTGGRVPKFWRPPYGDSDRRVSAIAKEVFGLTTVIWNQDTIDWNAPDAAHIQASMTGFLASPKSPGLMILEHESKDITVAGFIQSYPMIASNGWNFASLARVIGDGRAYQNAQSSSSNDVQDSDILAGNGSGSSGSSAPTTRASSTSAAPSTTSSATTTTASTSQTAQNQAPSATTSQSAALAFRHDFSSGTLSALFSLAVVAFSSAFLL
ncbi:unnamed protein product [Cyclocybe aegerita]|uniref:chitin deacetylase n=1 Tax=Cyclocybe aegerita TaxID=1973307 RepID=A0A8S0WDM8_CYCAE|nr:unnamed protein product [Cyclocybe aegerita]